MAAPDLSEIDDRIRNSFSKQAVMDLLGAEVSSVEAGRVVLELPFRSDLTQQNGFLHAGVISAVLDSACGYAALTLMPANCDVLTIEFKINLLAPAKGERFVFKGEVTKSGRTIMVSDGKAFSVSADEEKLIATMTGTMMVMRERGEKS